MREAINYCSLAVRMFVRWKQGKFDEAIELAKECLNLAIKFFGDENHNVAVHLSILADLYYFQEKYTEAEPFYLKALGIWEPLLNGNNFEVFATLNSLANLKYTGSIYVQFLAIKKRLFDGSNSEVATRLNRLAIIYKNQKKYSEAEFLMQQVLAIKQRIFKGDHRDVAISLNALGNLYYYQEKYSEAEPLFLQNLAMNQRIFKGDHRDVAINLKNLADVYYNNQKKYSEAEPLYVQALAMRQRLFKRDHLDVATSLKDLADLYFNQKKYSEAEPLYVQALAMRQRLFKGDHWDVFISLAKLAILYGNENKYSEAEPLLQEALEMSQCLSKEDNSELAKLHSNCIAGTGRMPIPQEKIPTLTPKLNAQQLISSNIFLAHLYYYQGKYSEAEALYTELLGIWEPLLKGNNSEVATSLNNLANIYFTQDKYKEAEPLHLQALAMRQRLFKGDNSEVATSLNSLANLYYNLGKYSETETLHLQALAMRQRLFKDDNSEVATSLNNLAMLYNTLGKYSKAEPLLLQSLEISQRLFKGDNSDVFTPLNNLATNYSNQGKHSKAEPLFLQALEISQHLFPGDHHDVALSLNNLASHYSNQSKYKESELLYLQALEIYKNSGDHPAIATVLSNLASNYYDQGKYSEAEPFLQEALEIRQRLFPGDHHDVANSLSNLASNYYDQGKYSEAELFFLQALEINQGWFNDAHPELTVILTNLAILYAATNRHEQALKLFKEATEIQHCLMSQEFVGSSENDRTIFLDNIRTTQYNLLSVVYQYFYPLEESEEKSQAIQTAFDLVLKRKALSNTASAAFNAAMYSDRYPHLKDSFERWRSRWQQIINLQFSLYLPENLSRLEANKKILSELHIEVEDLEKNITVQVPELCLENQLVDRKAIALELPENSTLIEFVYFSVFDFTTNQYQNPRYLAFILPAQQPENVQMIDLGEADKIDDLIGKVRQAVSPIHKENMGIATKTWQPEKAEPHNHFFELTNTIFKPLQNYLQGQQLFICPDGVLTLIPFEILSLDAENNQLLIDQYQITYLTAGRDLLRYKYQPQPNRLASESLVIADPNFDLSVNQTIASTSTPAKKENLSINLNSLTNEIIETFGQEDNKPFSPVPMTREIAEAAASNFKVNPLLQNDALKTYLTNGKCPQNLVIATHGFFLSQNAPPPPDLKKAEFIQPGFRFRQIQTAENPLLRSGLALAGANTWLLGGEIPPEAGEGIVFAQDVAGFDLWANKLIILIACETAVGDVKIGEGVKGLRSAFTAAGARLLIMSLWSIPAQVSILLMNRFFINFQEKNLSCQQSLQEAQNYIRTLTRKELESLPTGQQIIQQIRSALGEKYPQLVEQWELQNNPLQARYFWGAWVCVGREF